MSKLLVIMCVRELAVRITASSTADGSESSKKPFVVVNNVASGWCQTGLFRNEKWGAGQNIALKILGRSDEEGARTLVHGATEAARESHGGYLSECQVKEASPFMKSPKGTEVQRKLWKEVVAKLEQVRPGIGEVF
jgi:retinol dehydrogenase 12